MGFYCRVKDQVEGGLEVCRVTDVTGIEDGVDLLEEGGIGGRGDLDEARVRGESNEVVLEGAVGMLGEIDSESDGSCDGAGDHRTGGIGHDEERVIGAFLRRQVIGEGFPLCLDGGIEVGLEGAKRIGMARVIDVVSYIRADEVIGEEGAGVDLGGGGGGRKVGEVRGITGGVMAAESGAILLVGERGNGGIVDGGVSLGREGGLGDAKGRTEGREGLAIIAGREAEVLAGEGGESAGLGRRSVLGLKPLSEKGKGRGVSAGGEGIDVGVPLGGYKGESGGFEGGADKGIEVIEAAVLRDEAEIAGHGLGVIYGEAGRYGAEGTAFSLSTEADVAGIEEGAKGVGGIVGEGGGEEGIDVILGAGTKCAGSGKEIEKWV